MRVRKPTLEEWFLQYQMVALRKRHVHFPVDLDLNVTSLVREHKLPGRRPPYTAILIKVVAVLAKEHPVVNRAVFRTIFGARIVEFDEVNVNVPVVYRHEGRDHVGAMVLRNADRLTIAEIATRLKEEAEVPLAARPVGRRVIGRANVFWNRLILRLIHFLVYNFPKLYLKFGGGGISVSSLMNFAEPGFVCRPISFGHTALTFCCSDVRVEGDEHVMRIGIGCDHLAGYGHEAIASLRALAQIAARCAG